mmetsp:Transcript_5073/g.12844  ORF Transcript_5073/g.12844 Transcript_5073/m.12844 type:complete len:198 (-) Transcript_5073:169-762(-)|eukprot:CAMPEP_0113504462 /NCGR_PEP_ID=MMETSP0014_2-20120614/34729_1 /TAXON_ID=2857 /ORGANISM="Nitzschia sp." /LENGTH=197 /DNA_ID=CAMNT_0000399575 /DNA_START=106 /DNA_END=699 /DNA_ORIENTATION=+ /assembly_acc=CAM_ASM_000159
MTVSTTTQALVRQKYRSLGRMVRKLPEENPYSRSSRSCNQLTADKGWEQLRGGFRKPVSPSETLERRLKNADDKIAFLKMITPKESTVTSVKPMPSTASKKTQEEAGSTTPSSSSSSGQAFGFSGSGSGTGGGGGGGRWIYRNGERLEVSEGTVRDSKGRVVSNWDGKNLDPEQVKRHNHHLKRLGFRNNGHAKGIF